MLSNLPVVDSNGVHGLKMNFSADWSKAKERSLVGSSLTFACSLCRLYSAGNALKPLLTYFFVFEANCYDLVALPLRFGIHLSSGNELFWG